MTPPCCPQAPGVVSTQLPRTGNSTSPVFSLICGAGYIEVSALALGALRELGEEEDGYITDDGDGLRIWIGDDAFELEPAEPGAG